MLRVLSKATLLSRNVCTDSCSCRLMYPAEFTSLAWLAADALQFTATQARPSSPAALQADLENIAAGRQ